MSVMWIKPGSPRRASNSLTHEPSLQLPCFVLKQKGVLCKGELVRISPPKAHPPAQVRLHPKEEVSRLCLFTAINQTVMERTHMRSAEVMWGNREWCLDYANEQEGLERTSVTELVSSERTDTLLCHLIHSRSLPKLLGTLGQTEIWWRREF